MPITKFEPEPIDDINHVAIISGHCNKPKLKNIINKRFNEYGSDENYLFTPNDRVKTSDDRLNKNVIDSKQNIIIHVPINNLKWAHIDIKTFKIQIYTHPVSTYIQVYMERECQDEILDCAKNQIHTYQKIGTLFSKILLNLDRGWEEVYNDSDTYSVVSILIRASLNYNSTNLKYSGGP